MYKISIILTIFNKEFILQKILESLFTLSSENIDEYIFVLDGCTDNSEEILNNCIQNILNKNIIYKKLYANNVFELKANNIGLKEVKNNYAIIVQDDMLIKEKNWDQRLIIPILKFNDIWAVTARTSCSLNINGEWYNIKEGPVGHNYDENSQYPRNIVYVGQVVNRGPLLIDVNVIKKLGYFDETLPGVQGSDDVDLCLKAFKLYNLRCCQFWISYYSPLNWGSQRIGPNIQLLQIANEINTEEVIKRYYDILKNWNYDEIRYI